MSELPSLTVGRITGDPDNDAVIAARIWSNLTGQPVTPDIVETMRAEFVAVAAAKALEK